MKEISGGGDTRPVFVDRKTGYLLTYDSPSGKHVPLLDARTRKPIMRRMVYVDALTGNYNAIDMKTGDVSEVIDPVTGKPMSAKWSKEALAESAQSQAASAEPDAQVEQALAQADADDISALESGPTRRDDEPSLMDLIEQMEDENFAERASGTAIEPIDEPAAESESPVPSAPPAQPDYLQSLPRIDTRDIARTDGMDIATLMLVALVIVAVIVGQMLYWALA